MFTKTIGVFRPNAEILCGPCDSPESEPEQCSGSDWHDIGRCDYCGMSCWLPSKVAHEQAVLIGLKMRGVKAAMDQTGGMCSAVTIDAGEEGAFLLIEDEEMEDFHFLVFEDKSDGNENPIIMTASIREAVNAVVGMLADFACMGLEDTLANLRGEI